MASSTGRTTFQAPSTRPHKTPIGIPIATHSSTATPMKPSVSAVSRQYASPSRPQMSSPTKAKNPTWKLRKNQPSRKTTTHIVSQDICRSHSSTITRSRVWNGHSMTSKVAFMLLSTQKTTCSTQSPTGICQLSSTVF